MSARAAVLLVEDDRDEIDVALRALGRSGIAAKVEIARDGHEALESLGLEPDDAEPVPTPDVVFLDLRMPRVDGFEVLRRVRADPRTADLPVVVLSRSDRVEDVKRSYALGANSVLVKRLDSRGPGAYFAEAVRYWLELNRAPAPEGGQR